MAAMPLRRIICMTRAVPFASRRSASKIGFTGFSLTDDPPLTLESAKLSESRFVVLARHKVLVDNSGSIAWQGYDQVKDHLAISPTVYLGRDNVGCCFAVDAAFGTKEAALPTNEEAKLVTLRSLAAKFGPDVPTVSRARSLLEWHGNNQFCSKCGDRTRTTVLGTKRTCAGCSREVFPRVDPVVIMMVLHPTEDLVLLGRSNRPGSFFSLLAGFVSPGETIEEAVVREVYEESAVRVCPKSVQYLASQPWPLGQGAQLMLCCQAKALPSGTAITVDGVEMLEARWVSREEVSQALGRWATKFKPSELPEGELLLPPPVAAANWLLSSWMQDPPPGSL